MVTTCDLCGDLICKYQLDFEQSGAVRVSPGSSEDEKEYSVCRFCALAITKEMVHQI